MHIRAHRHTHSHTHTHTKKKPLKDASPAATGESFKIKRLHQIAFHCGGIKNHGCHRGEACRVAATLQLPIETECGTQSELSPNCKERAPCDPLRLYLNTRDASMAAFKLVQGVFFPSCRSSWSSCWDPVFQSVGKAQLWGKK